jgi:hypothetical protein
MREQSRRPAARRHYGRPLRQPGARHLTQDRLGLAIAGSAALHALLLAGLIQIADAPTATTWIDLLPTTSAFQVPSSPRPARQARMVSARPRPRERRERSAVTIGAVAGPPVATPRRAEHEVVAPARPRPDLARRSSLVGAPYAAPDGFSSQEVGDRPAEPVNLHDERRTEPVRMVEHAAPVQVHGEAEKRVPPAAAPPPLRMLAVAPTAGPGLVSTHSAGTAHVTPQPEQIATGESPAQPAQAPPPLSRLEQVEVSTRVEPVPVKPVLSPSSNPEAFAAASPVPAGTAAASSGAPAVSPTGIQAMREPVLALPPASAPAAAAAPPVPVTGAEPTMDPGAGLTPSSKRASVASPARQMSEGGNRAQPEKPPPPIRLDREDASTLASAVPVKPVSPPFSSAEVPAATQPHPAETALASSGVSSTPLQAMGEPDLALPATLPAPTPATAGETPPRPMDVEPTMDSGVGSTAPTAPQPERIADGRNWTHPEKAPLAQDEVPGPAEAIPVKPVSPPSSRAEVPTAAVPVRVETVMASSGARGVSPPRLRAMAEPDLTLPATPPELPPATAAAQPVRRAAVEPQMEPGEGSTAPVAPLLEETTAEESQTRPEEAVPPLSRLKQVEVLRPVEAVPVKPVSSPAPSTEALAAGPAPPSEPAVVSPEGSILGLGLGLLKVFLEGPRLRVTDEATFSVSGRIQGRRTAGLVLRVNDTLQEVSADRRSFTASVPLVPGSNRITALVTGPGGLGAEDSITVDYVPKVAPVTIALTSPLDGLVLGPDDPPAVVVDGRVEDRGTDTVWVVANERAVAVPVHDGHFHRVVPMLEPRMHLWVESRLADGAARRSDPITVSAPDRGQAGLLVLDWLGGGPASKVEVRATRRAAPAQLDDPAVPVSLRSLSGSGGGVPEAVYIKNLKPGVYTFTVRLAGSVSTTRLRPTVYVSGNGGAIERALRSAEVDSRAGAVVAKILLPQGILWDDEGWTGKSESVDAIIKFRLPEGITWAERKADLR